MQSFIQIVINLVILQVKNILVVGHSCCGGIRALMSMNDEVDKRLSKLVQFTSCILWLSFVIFSSIKLCLSLLKNHFNSSFIQSWVVNGKDARSWTKAAASKLSFDQQCKHCEKVTNVLYYANVCHDLATTQQWPILVILLSTMLNTLTRIISMI